MGITERKEREFRRREDEILGAAVRLFDRDDWQDVTIDTIAQEAEIGKGTVYLHFPSKEEIYARLALDFERQLLESLRRIDPGLAPLEQMREAIRLFFAAHEAGARCHRVVEYCGREDFRRRISEGTQREFQRVGDEITAVIHGILRRGIAEGTFPDRPLPILVYGPHSALVGAVKLRASGCLHGETPEASVEEIARFVLAGLMFQDRVPGCAAAEGVLAGRAAEDHN